MLAYIDRDAALLLRTEGKEQISAANQLIHGLFSSDHYIKPDIHWKLKYPDRYSREKLIRLLQHKNSAIRTAATIILGVLEEKRAAPYIVKNLKSDNPELLSFSLDTLEKLAYRPASDHVIKFLYHDEIKIQRLAVTALATTGKVDAIPHLIRIMQENVTKPSPALFRIFVPIHELAAYSAGQIKHPKTFTLLKNALDKSPEHPQHIITAMGYLNTPSAFPILKKIAENKTEKTAIRISAVKSLGHLKHPDVTEVFKHLLQDKQYEIRINVVWALSELKTPEATTLLLKSLDDKNKYIASTALNAFALNYNKRVRPHVIRIIKHMASNPVQSENSWKLEHLANILRHHPFPEAWPYLLKLYRNKQNLRDIFYWDLSYALAMTGKEKAIPVLLELLVERKQDRPFIARALGSIRSRETIDKIFPHFTNSDPELRQYIIIALAATGLPHAVPYLIKATKDKNENVKNAAIRALTQFKGNEVLKIMLKALKRKNSSILHSAIYWLGETKKPEVTPHLLPFLKHPKYGLVTAEALIKLDSQKAKKAARESGLLIE